MMASVKMLLLPFRVTPGETWRLSSIGVASTKTNRLNAASYGMVLERRGT